VVNQLILTVTRQCNLRCSYCPTAKDGWPSLDTDDARKAIRLFVDRCGGGVIKLFGGEPLLVPEVVRAAMEEARNLPEIRWVYLSTNGLGLDNEWLEYLASYPKSILTLSMDGTPEDHRQYRRATGANIPDTYSHVLSILPQLLSVPRLVVTQTVPPATAGRMHLNFKHLHGLGFRRFNLLPGYYLPWREEQLAGLESSLEQVAEQIIQEWTADRKLYLRNLFTWAPTPFFNTGMVVDADGTIHPSNIGLSGALDSLRSETQVGTLDAPPSPDELRAGAERTNGLLKEHLAERVWESTLAVDRLLSGFCRDLYPHWAAYRKRRRAA
jgi:sulfatase maturation enzyme AslB (radical SAM superfamily)